MKSFCINTIVTVFIFLSFNLKADIITFSYSGTLNLSSGADVIGLDGVKLYSTMRFNAANDADRIDVSNLGGSYSITNATWYSEWNEYYTDPFVDSLGNNVILSNSSEKEYRLGGLSPGRIIGRDSSNYFGSDDFVQFHTSTDDHLDDNYTASNTQRFHLPNFVFYVGEEYFNGQNPTIDSIDFNDLTHSNLTLYNPSFLYFEDGGFATTVYEFDNLVFDISVSRENTGTNVPEPATSILTIVTLSVAITLRRRKNYFAKLHSNPLLMR